MVDQSIQATANLGSEVNAGVRSIVLTEFTELRELVVSGGASELRIRVIRDSAKGRAMLAGATDVKTFLAAIGARIRKGFVLALGEENIPRLRELLGLKEPIVESID